MKSKGFVLILRTLIREECKKILKEEVSKLRAELLTEFIISSPVKKAVKPETSIVKNVEPVVSRPKPTNTKKYSSDSMINELLRETVVDSQFTSVPIDVTGISMMGGDVTMEPPIEAIPASVTDTFVKDYSKVLKKSYEKRPS